jgi:hypothetical protein
MPKKKRRRTATTPTFMTTAGWRWRSFPVLFAFVCGAFVMGLLNGVTNPVGAVFFYLALFGVAFGAAHIVTRWLAARRTRSRAPGTAPPRTGGERGGKEPQRPPSASRPR